ncbi:MAG: hypothetical protein JNM29_07485 [Candidatus Odyssella sp.]|nr:hypothetical protein [Candidatus Odyssella sp.]
MTQDLKAADRVDPATPTAERCVTSYPARRKYRPGVVHPPNIPGVEGVIDIHCHAHEGQQDPLSLAKLASENRMGGLLYKTVGPISSGDYRPGLVVKKIVEDLHRWSDAAGVKPTQCWAGYGITMDNRPPSLERLRQNIADGVVGVWLPVFNHANTLFKVGGRRVWWDRNADPSDHSAPLPWEEALRCGYYLVDDRGRLKPEIEEILRVVVDSGVSLFYGHATHREIFAVAEFLGRFAFKRGVIDHPFSPFVDLSLAQMKQLAEAGIYLNFTYDELSPLLGVDPARMYAAIRHVGVEQVTLSSDAGEPLFPNSAECMRLIRSYMAAFGLNEQELAITCRRNPARIVGLSG